MEKIPASVQSRFHSFCKHCPLCDVQGDSSDLFAFGEEQERFNVITCSSYDFCERMAKAVNDGLVDMRTRQEPVSNVDTTQ